MTRPIKVIIFDIEPQDYEIACRAVKFQLVRVDGGKSSIMQYEINGEYKTFYVKLNKNSVTVRKCG